MTREFSPAVNAAALQNEVTAKIIAQLENGVRPWAKSWKTGERMGMPGMPRRVCGSYYSGINIVLCWSAMEQNGWTNTYFMSFDQAKKLGGCVRKGSKGTKVCYYSTFTTEKENAQGETEEKTIPFMKLYTVFNVEQIDGLPDRFYQAQPVRTAETIRDNIREADAFFAALGVPVRHGGDKAYYSPTADFVAMPNCQAFRSREDYYSTLGHEMTHSTGHASRCNRVFGQRFGDNAYAFEELVAELGAAFLCAELGIDNDPREDHASYLKSWIDVLRTDSRAIFTAASKASQAVAWMRDQQKAELAEAA